MKSKDLYIKDNILYIISKLDSPFVVGFSCYIVQISGERK